MGAASGFSGTLVRLKTRATSLGSKTDELATRIIRRMKFLVRGNCPASCVAALHLSSHLKSGNQSRAVREENERLAENRNVVVRVARLSRPREVGKVDRVGTVDPPPLARGCCWWPIRLAHPQALRSPIQRLVPSPCPGNAAVWPANQTANPPTHPGKERPRHAPRVITE